MEHLAIDLGSRESQVCIRSEKGEVLVEQRVPTKKLEPFLKKRPHCRVVVETCAESHEVAAMAKRCGHQVRVVPATLGRTLGVGHRGIKTDQRDAQALSQASCHIDLPSVHLRSEPSRALKTNIGMRDGLISARTQLINNVRGWLRTKLISIPSGYPNTFKSRVTAALNDEVPTFVGRQLAVIEELCTQIKAADKEIKELAEADGNCKRLMTVPGVGPLTAALFVATVDDIGRFSNAQQLQSYLGLTPGEKSSSMTKKRTSITKAGPSDMRRLLNQSCWVMQLMKSKPPLAHWGEQIAKRRGKQIAVTAMCRKLSGILFAMMRDQTDYNSTLVTKTRRYAEVMPKI